jgi:hypothetical protein
MFFYIFLAMRSREADLQSPSGIRTFGSRPGILLICMEEIAGASPEISDPEISISDIHH